jgi:hypothetical protein
VETVDEASIARPIIPSQPTHINYTTTTTTTTTTIIKIKINN